MDVTNRALTGWEIKPTMADRGHIQATIECLHTLCETPVECQAEAVSAVDSLKKIQEAFPPAKLRPRKLQTATA